MDTKNLIIPTSVSYMKRREYISKILSGVVLIPGCLSNDRERQDSSPATTSRSQNQTQPNTTEASRTYTSTSTPTTTSTPTSTSTPPPVTKETDDLHVRNFQGTPVEANITIEPEGDRSTFSADLELSSGAGKQYRKVGALNSEATIFVETNDLNIEHEWIYNSQYLLTITIRDNSVDFWVSIS